MSLEAFLEQVPAPPSPQAALEQVRTPPTIAAAFLLLAHKEGHLEGQRVLDLGCGTGILSFGAAWLGADVTGVDIDEASLAVARGLELRVPKRPRFVQADVQDWAPAADTVVMNPPFGAQKRHADRPFYQAAVAQNVWFLAQTRTESYLQAMAREKGYKIRRAARWNYPLEAQHAFHTRNIHAIDVGAYWMGPEAPSVTET